MHDLKQTPAHTAGIRRRCLIALVAGALSAASADASRAWAQGEPPKGGNRSGADAVITVTVSHPAEEGDVACALFATEEGFPDAGAKDRGVVHPARGTSTTCRFAGVAPGTYAVAVLLDKNRNGKADTNFLGIPSEPWGVSNNARPAMRAPKFDEASFTVAAGATLTIAIDVK